MYGSLFYLKQEIIDFRIEHILIIYFAWLQFGFVCVCVDLWSDNLHSVIGYSKMLSKLHY